MPRDPQRRQKALLKKRRKQTATKAHAVQQGLQSAALQAIIGNAHTYPLVECFISQNWDKGEGGLVEILIVREQPDGELCLALYLLDIYCLGLKNTLGHFNISRKVYQARIIPEFFPEQEPLRCSAELAHQMIYASIDYAAQFGFKPHQDFAVTQHFLAPRGELEEPHTLQFGHNGKPCYISGPRDQPRRILRQLEKTAGPDNYEFLIITPDPFSI